MPRTVVPDALRREPFTATTAARFGVSKNVLRGTGWRRLFRSVWIAADVELSRWTWLSAARLALPLDAVLCGPSALDVHGTDVRAADDVVVHAAFSDAVPRPRAGLRLCRMALAVDEVMVVGRWLVTTPLRTAFDCARLLPITDAVVAVDALTQAGLITLEDLAAFASAHPGVRWVRRIARVLALADAGAESPMESRLRLVLVMGGLPRPRTQVEIRDAAGKFIARVDLAYEERRVVIEYDGAWHWKRRRQDDRRRDAIRALGWTVLVFDAEEVYQRPGDIVTAVGSALHRAA